MLNLRKVHDWTKGRFVMDSGYYAGRGPTQSDLNSPLLEMFYSGIKKDIGTEAAVNFVRFVNNLSDLSASAFIVAFERFAANDCKVVEIAQQKGDDTRLTGHGAALEAQAFAVIASALTGPKRSEAELRLAHENIKCEFIRKHQKEIPTGERRQTKAYSFL